MNDLKEHNSTGSYVEPRVPSITGYGQRNVIGKPKKLLDYSLEKSNDQSGIPKIDVCLRLKPRGNNSLNELDTLTVLNDTTVACNNGNAREDVTEYTFSSVFGPNVDQNTFFNTWVYDKVLRFLNGNNELLFAYGTTNAGKTYTIHGNVNDPGIIPRTLMLVFNTLNNKLMTQCKYKPDKVVAAHILDDNLMKCEDDIRNNILNNWSNEKTFEKTQAEFKSYISHIDDQITHNIDNLTSDNIAKMFDLVNNDKKVALNHGNVSYTIWVTYSEIYNESIFDLLVTYMSKRKPLKLSLDQNKNVYVKDLTHVFVQSAEEAYKIMAFGRNNLRVASNNLNKSSSRSHCIFTLKLMRIENIENPTTAVISSISFCDLAGSERLKKTNNMGDRLIESKNINTSLLVLNKCFSVLRENQKRGENHMIVPIRESKLTQMFQNALIGNNRTGISMAVNVDVSPSLFEETKQVLYVSAIIRAINKSKTKPKPRPSFALWVANNRKSGTYVKSKQDSIDEEDENIDSSIYEKKLMIVKEEFEVRLNEEKANLRKELLGQFQSLLQNNNTFHTKQKETMIKNKTEMYENKIKRLKAMHLDEIQEKNEQLKKIQQNPNAINNYENRKNKSEIENYEFRIGELELQKEELIAEINDMKHVQEDLIVKNQVLKDIKEDLDSKNQEIETYKNMIEEANNIYEKMEATLNEFSNKFDEMNQEIEEKDLEIERLTGSLEAKDNIITEMEINYEELVLKETEKSVELLDEKQNIILNLENTIKKLKIKNKQYSEEKSEIAKQYTILKQQHLNKSNDQSNGSNDSVLSSTLSAKNMEITKLQDHLKELQCQLKENEMKFKALQNMINDLKSVNTKPKMKSISVLTDLSNIQIPLIINVSTEDKENKITKSEQRPQRKCKNKTPLSNKKKNKIVNKGTPDLSEQMWDEVIDNIPISTRKRRLFDNKPPLTDSSNIPSDNFMDSVLSPTRILQQVTKLRTKK